MSRLDLGFKVVMCKTMFSKAHRSSDRVAHFLAKQRILNHVSESDEIDFQSLAENNVDMIAFVGLDLVMHYASPSCQHIFGWTPEEMCGKGPDVFVHPEDLPIVAASHQSLLIEGVDKTPSTVRMRKKDGTYAWMEINARLSKDRQTGEINGIVLTMRNITERKLREQELELLALRDGLTGLANRRQFDHALDREWKRAWRERAQLSLIMLDVDCFKKFNDHYGHLAGDDCLRAVAHAIDNTVSRATDLVARYGGEEFAVILPGTDPAGALLVAEGVRANIEDLRIPHKANASGSNWVTASLGVATILPRNREMTATPEALVLAADGALYKSKSEGRNRVTVAQLSTAP